MQLKWLSRNIWKSVTRFKIRSEVITQPMYTSYITLSTEMIFDVTNPDKFIYLCNKKTQEL